MYKLRTLLYFMLAVWPVSTAAQDQGNSLNIFADLAISQPAITVLASGYPAAINASGQAISILGRDEIASVQGADPIRALERLPGVTITRNGGPGSFTGLRVRGAEAEQLLVLVDGINVADAASPANGFDFGTLIPAGIGQIELLRGANSTIWGSQAMGGVLQVKSSLLDGAIASAEYGGPATLYGQLAAGANGGRLAYDFSAAFVHSGGISAAATGEEADPFRQWQGGGRVELAPAENLRLNMGLTVVDAQLDLDGFPAPDFTLADTDDYQDMRRVIAFAGAAFMGETFELSGVYSRSGTRRETYDRRQGGGANYTTEGREERVGLRGRWAVSNEIHAQFGGERVWSRFETLFDPLKIRSSNSAYTQIGYNPSGGIFLINAGLRVDSYAGFGSSWSLGADGAVRLGGGWRIRASYGEGFKVPSLFQAFSDYGNPALRPERSRSYDAGIERGARDSGEHFALSLFRRDSHDLIDFTSCYGVADGICAGRPFGTYDNIGRARAQGVEAEVGVWVNETLQLQAAWSYVAAINRTVGAVNQGKHLARRPRHALTFSANWETPLGELTMGADLRAVSGSFDDAGNFTPLEAYAAGTIRMAYPLDNQAEIFGRIENIWDAQYQTAAGYGTPGRSAYIGARARF